MAPTAASPRQIPPRPLPAAATRQGDVAMANNTAQDTPRRSPRLNSATENNNNRRSPRLAAQREAAATATAASATNDLAADFAAGIDALPAAIPCCTNASCRGGPRRGKTENIRDRSGVRECLDQPKSKRPSDDELFKMQRAFLERLSQFDKCPSIKKKSKFGTCNCLTILRDEKIRDAVAAYVLDFQKMDPVDRGQRVVEWFKYAGREKKSPKFALQFDATDVVLCVETETKMNNATLCRSALGNIFDLGDTFLWKCSKHAKSTGVYPKHGNTGKRNKAFKDDSDVMKALRKYFEMLEKLGEVRATRFISRLVEGMLQTGTRDDEEEYIFLPACNSKRSLFYRYLKEQGVEAQRTQNGNYKIISKSADAKPYVSRSTFRRFWKREFPHIRITKPSEDICALCCRWANRHRSFTNFSKRLAPPEPNVEDGGDDDDSDDESTHDGIQAAIDVPPTRRSMRGRIPRNTGARYCYESESDDDDDDEEEADMDETTDDHAAAAQEPATATASSDDVDTELNPLAEASEQTADMEVLLMAAAVHVKQASAQRIKYNYYILLAIKDAKEGVAHAFRTYCFVVDYGQNMELPLFSSQQPGTVYYYSPIGVYNLGVVNHAYDYGNKRDPTYHMDAHVYHEGVGKKGSNCVASFILKSLRRQGVIRDNDIGGHLVIVFDNCAGQNKNNTIMKMLMYLYEMKYFKKITFLFLIVGHTKNAADRLFNSLKSQYHNMNIYTMNQLTRVLNTSEYVTVLKAEPSDFKDYNKYFSHFYRKLPGQISQNHIFSLGSMEDDAAGGCKEGSDFKISLRKSDREEDAEKTTKCILHNWYNKLPNRNYKDKQEALKNRLKDLKELKGDLLEQLPTPGINPYKRNECATKYIEEIPEYDDSGIRIWDDELYAPLTEEEKAKVKMEAKMNHEKKVEVTNMKKRKLAENMEAAAAEEEPPLKKR